jgi:hypothetical protein
MFKKYPENFKPYSVNEIEILANKKYYRNQDLWSVYANGYKEAANLICEQIIDKRVLGKYSMIYPVMFLYRHYLELQLKNIISLTDNAVSLLLAINDSNDEIKSFEANHNLLALYKNCLDKLKNFSKKADEDIDYEGQEFIELRKIIQEFEEHDRSSQSFRYPIDRNNNFNLQEVDYVNIKNVYKIINKSTEILDGIESWLEEKIDLIKDLIEISTQEKMNLIKDSF